MAASADRFANWDEATLDVTVPRHTAHHRTPCAFSQQPLPASHIPSLRSIYRAQTALTAQTWKLVTAIIASAGLLTAGMHFA